MPKRSRIDDASQELIDRMRDEDELEAIHLSHKNEVASIQKLYEDSISEIYKQFKTRDPENLPDRDQLIMKQKLEYEETLKQDRINLLNSEREEKEKNLQEKVHKRKRRRYIDKKLNECSLIASQDAKEINWKDIGKQKHLQLTLQKSKDSMSEEQELKYKQLMDDLKKNGHKVLNKK